MGYMTITIGILFIICGLIAKRTKWTWIYLGIRKKSLDVESSINYMCIVSFVMGTLYCILGCTYFFFYVPAGMLYIMLFVIVILQWYGEKKYTIK